MSRSKLPLVSALLVMTIALFVATDVGATAPRQLDDEVGLEVGVDDHGVAGLLVFDEVGVGAEPAVGGHLYAKAH